MIRRNLRMVGAAALLAAPAVLGAQDPTRCGTTPATQREVVGLKFDGNTFFRDAILANGIITEPSSWTRRHLHVFGKRRCLDQKSFQDDVLRVMKVYRESGYKRIRVDTVVSAAGTNKVRVQFTIREGEPMPVDSLKITGVDSLPERDEILKRLPLLEDNPVRFNEYALQQSIDSITKRLRDRGYPTAEVFRETHTDTSAYRARVQIDVEPGTRAKLGKIDISITPLKGTIAAISPATVRRLLGVKEGELYRESRLQRAKLNLYRTEAYRGVTVELDSIDLVPPGDSLVTIHVSLAEGQMHAARVSGGYGSLDCFRSDGEYRNNNFLSRARKLELRAHLSKIGIGRPLGGAAAMCPLIRSDPYSEKLNYYLGATFSDPTASIGGFLPSFTAYSETRGEYKAFLSTTPIGALVSGSRQSARTRQTFAYQAAYRRTEAQPAVFCALQNLCLPEDYDPLLDFRWLATIGFLAEQNWRNDALYPTRGGGIKVELRHASRFTGSDPRLQFSKATADLGMFFDLGKGFVLAPRVRVGAVVGPSFAGSSRFVPPEERLFAGGGTTLRGFDNNDLGPKVYIARGYDTVHVDGTPIGQGEVFGPTDTVLFRTQSGVREDRSVPTGGSALVVANLELRAPAPKFGDILQLAAFVDAGELWIPGAPQPEDRFRNIKFTPGVGIRALTVFGAIRVDVAYSPYAPRAGAAFFDTPIAQGGQLYCVSPGNTLPVTHLGATDGGPTQMSGSCVTDFRPPGRTGTWGRLHWSIGIGQAF